MISSAFDVKRKKNVRVTVKWFSKDVSFIILCCSWHQEEFNDLEMILKTQRITLKHAKDDLLLDTILLELRLI